MLYSPKSPNFITLGDDENGSSCMGHNKNEILGEAHLNMT